MNKILCWIFGHKKCIEDIGGYIFEACERCNWIGRGQDVEGLEYEEYKGEKNE